MIITKTGQNARLQPKSAHLSPVPIVNIHACPKFEEKTFHSPVLQSLPWFRVS